MIDNIETQKVQLYRCFSQRLSHEIRVKLNQMPVKVYKHTNGRIVNVFIMNAELSKLLKEWSQNNPNKGGNKK